MSHSHRKRKDSLETLAAFSWILILTSNFRGGPSDSGWIFFKIASASWLWCSWNYNWLFYMLDNDNIINKLFQRQLRRSLQLKKIIAMLLYVFYFAQPQHTNITGIWLVLSTVEVRKEFTGFQVATWNFTSKQ